MSKRKHPTAKAKAAKPKAIATMAPPTPATVLVLRLCNKDMTSHSGFTWPESGPVSCPDWKPTKECGNGLHGWLWGSGDHSAANFGEGKRWLVVEVAAADVVDLNGKVKFPRGVVVHCGDQATATKYLAERLPAELRGGRIIGGTASAGDRGTASAGDLGTASAGEAGILVIRYYDDKANRWRIAVGYPGEGGIEKGKRYRVKDGALVESEEDSETKEAREYAAKISKMKPEDRP